MAKYALFILTYRRPDKQITIRTLKKYGYSGKIFLLCDDSDPELSRYKEIYGDRVKTFCKKDYVDKFDRMINEVRYDAVVYARRAVYDVAAAMGLDYIIVMDDDYNCIMFSIDSNGNYAQTHVKDIDKLMKIHLKYLATTNIAALALAQGGDYPAGPVGFTVRSGFKPLRKAMNVFFLKVSEPVIFNGMINEDSTMAIQEAQKGRVILTNVLAHIKQSATQKTKGGLTDIYKEVGTYQKSFYTVLAAPSAVKVMYQSAVGRIHHRINGNYAYPRIVSPDVKK